MNPTEFLANYLMALDSKKLAKNVIFRISQDGNNWTISFIDTSNPTDTNTTSSSSTSAQPDSETKESSPPLNASSNTETSQKPSPNNREFEEWLAEKKKFEEYGKALTKAKQGVYVKPYITGEGKYIAAHIRKFPIQPKDKVKPATSAEVDAKLKLILE